MAVGGEGFEVFGGVLHQDWVAGEVKHGEIVPVVSDGHDLGGFDAVGTGEAEEGGTLGAAGGEDVHDGEVAVGVLGAGELDLGVGVPGGAAYGRDSGVFEEAGFGAAHAFDGSAEHHLDGWDGVEGELHGADLGDVGLVDLHPASDAVVEVFELLDDEGSAGVVSVGLDAVEGDDEGVAELGEVLEEPEGGVDGEVGGLDEGGGDGADDGTVRGDEETFGGEGVLSEDAHGVGVAASGGDDEVDSGLLGGGDGGAGAGGDAGVVVEEGSVHVDGDEADGWPGGGVWIGAGGVEERGVGSLCHVSILSLRGGREA